MDQFTQYLLQKAMRMKEGNISHVARLLGIPRGNLRYKLEKYQKSDNDLREIVKWSRSHDLMRLRIHDQ